MQPMLAFIVSRLLQSLAVMLAVSFLCFVLFNFVGDPVNNMVGQEATPAERAGDARASSGWRTPSASSSCASWSTRPTAISARAIGWRGRSPT